MQNLDNEGIQTCSVHIETIYINPITTYTNNTNSH